MEETFIPRKFHENNQDTEKQKQLKKKNTEPSKKWRPKLKYEDTKQYILRKNTQIDNKLLTEIKELSPKETHQLLSVMGVKMQRGGKITEYLGKKDNLVENITKKRKIE